eukprot:TRINITY_DN5354_c0_g1_i1.p1 TRINITY_DN5354_c0_g1~~TRINITY_DN5354_c0_g1_i1.p1  ORF type:complete len:573 (-),score=91.48 TRINITY_DN5354_c0_g1_i1:129-1847(-)
MVEHINAEVVLGTITDVSVLIEWLKSTYLYIRMRKNPSHYGIPLRLKEEEIDLKMREICLSCVNEMVSYDILSLDEDGFSIKPLEIGKTMARYSIEFETMKLFSKLSFRPEFSDLVRAISSASEFENIVLRRSEKKILNGINKDSRIRFPISGKISTNFDKRHCLIQSMLGEVPIREYSLTGEANQILTLAPRLCKCLIEIMVQKKSFSGVLHSILLKKCLSHRIWETSTLLPRQIEKIGSVYAQLLAKGGITSIESLSKSDPRLVERILNRNPPFGTEICQLAKAVPRYSVEVKTTHKNSATEILILLTRTNDLTSSLKKPTSSWVIVGDERNSLLLYVKIPYSTLNKELKLQVSTSRQITVQITDEIFIIEDYRVTYELGTLSVINIPQQSDQELVLNSSSETCKHTCKNKKICKHLCCKKEMSSKNEQKISDVKDESNRTQRENPQSTSEFWDIYEEDEFPVPAVLGPVGPVEPVEPEPHFDFEDNEENWVSLDLEKTERQTPQIEPTRTTSTENHEPSQPQNEFLSQTLASFDLTKVSGTNLPTTIKRPASLNSTVAPKKFRFLDSWI